MLKFIERYKLYRTEKKGMPRTAPKINELLKSAKYGKPYYILQGSKKGIYLTIDTLDKDDFGQYSFSPSNNLSSACSDIYKLICENQQFFPLTKIDFTQKQQIVDKFPRKYRELIDRLLTEIYTFYPDFAANATLSTPEEFKEHDKHQAFLYIKSSAYWALDCNEDLMKHFDSSITLKTIDFGLFGVYLKEEIISAQERWNQNNRDKVRASDRVYKTNNPSYSFAPDIELRERLEVARKPGEGNSELLTRLIKKGLGQKQIKIKYKLPSNLKHLEKIAQPVLELFASFYQIKKISNSDNFGQWKITDEAEKVSCYLFVTEAYEWSLESLKLNSELPECFDFDVHEWCDSNGVHLDELYESLED